MQPTIAAPAILLLVYRAWSRNSLTSAGILTAALTAIAHALHPWSVFFALLVVFFLAGTAVTKVKHDVKARLTISSSGSIGGEGPRTHVQVLANSICASIMILMHARQLHIRAAAGGEASCWSWGGDLLVWGIIANYAAVAADTFSSELGILSTSSPRLITSLSLRSVPAGTNGGITPLGTLAGFMGAATIALTSLILLPLCRMPSSSSTANSAPWSPSQHLALFLIITFWGGLGSLLDSFLGALLQASVVDIRSGKIIEGDGGEKVLIQDLGPWSLQFTTPGTDPAPVDPSAETTARTPNDSNILQRTSNAPHQEARDSHQQVRPASRKIESGREILDNNGVNLLMAACMSIGAMVAASWYWSIPISSILH